MAVFEVKLVSPNSAPASGGTRIYVRGRGFQRGAEVVIGDKRCTDVEVLDSGNLISCVVPPSIPGVYNIIVYNSITDYKLISSGFSFTQVQAPRPSVSASSLPVFRPLEVGVTQQFTALSVPGSPAIITADISRDTFDVTKNYDKLLFQRGRPVLHTELNELQDIERGKVVDVVQSAIGNGPDGRAFFVEENVGDNVNKIIIRKGRFFHEGNIVTLHQDVVLAGLTTPGGNRDDTVYCVYCFEEIDSAEDPNIKDPVLQIETTRRIKINVSIYIAEGSLLTVPPLGCKAFPIALLHRHASLQTIVKDCPCCVPSPPCSPCHVEGDIIDLRSTATQNYCSEGNVIYQTVGQQGTLGFTWTIGKVIVNSLFKDVVAGSASVPPSSTTFVYVDENGDIQQSLGQPPATIHLLKAKIVSNLTAITGITDLCIYAPHVGLHDHNSADVHINLQGGDQATSEYYHMTWAQFRDIANGDGGTTNYADAWHKHTLTGTDLLGLDDRYVNVTGDTMTGALSMYRGGLAAALIGIKQEPFVIDGLCNEIIITTDLGGPDAILLVEGPSRTAQEIADELNIAFDTHIPPITASAFAFTGRVQIIADTVGGASYLLIGGTAAPILGFEDPNDEAFGVESPAINANFVTFPEDGGTEIPRAGIFFDETTLSSPLDTVDRPGLDIVGAGDVGGPGRLIRLFDDVFIYGNLSVLGDIEGLTQYHNELLGIQGGIPGTEHFHMSEAEWGLLTGADGSVDVADILHTHLVFSRIEFTLGSQAPGSDTRASEVCGPDFVSDHCGLVTNPLTITGSGAAPDRNVLLLDNAFIAENLCWGGLASGHISPIAGFTNSSGCLTVEFDAKDLIPPSGQSGDATYTFDGDAPIEKYEWNFDYNGTFVTSGATYVNSGTSAATTYDYAAPGGLKRVALRVTNRHGHQDLRERQVNVINTACGPTCTNPPVATFTAQQVIGGLSVNFDASGTTPPSSPCVITKYEWNFNYVPPFQNVTDYLDSGTDPTVNFVYSSSGSKAVAIRVTNSGAQQDEYDTTITVNPVSACTTPPVANFTFAQQGTTLLVDFDSTTSTAGAAPCTITNREWDFNYDGVTFTPYAPATGQTTYTFTYGADGHKRIALRITNSGGLTNLRVQEFDLATGVLNAAFTIWPTSTPADLNTITFLRGENVTLNSTATAAGSPIVEYQWDLDYDGFTFNVDRTSSVAQITANLDNVFVADTRSLVVAHRVRTAGGTYSNIATRTSTLYYVPKFLTVPNFIGNHWHGFFDNGNPCGGNPNHLKIRNACGSSTAWPVTIKSNLPPGFSTNWSATPASVIDNTGTKYYLGSQTSTSVNIVEANDPGVLITSLGAYYVDLRCSITKGARTASASVRIYISILFDTANFGGIDNKHIVNGIGKTKVTLQFRGANMQRVMAWAPFKVELASTCGTHSLYYQGQQSNTSVSPDGSLVTVTIAFAGLPGSVLWRRNMASYFGTPSPDYCRVAQLWLSCDNGGGMPAECFGTTVAADFQVVIDRNYGPGNCMPGC